MELNDILKVSILKESENESKEYRELFRRILDQYKEKFGVNGIADMTEEQKKEFFQAVDDAWLSDDEEEEREEEE